MRIILTIAILFANTVNCFSNTDDAYLNKHTLITLESETHFEFKKSKEIKTIRRKIQLLTQKSVNDFSTFYFQKDQEVEISIEKENGEETKINVSEFIEVNAQVPSYFSSYNSHSVSYKKVAIPNLEINDIINFTIKSTHYSFYSWHSDIESYLYRVSIENNNPILKKTISIKTDGKLAINCRLLNDSTPITRLGKHSVVIEFKNLNIAANRKWGKLDEKRYLKFQLTKNTLKAKKRGNALDYVLKNTPNPENLISAKLNVLLKNTAYSEAVFIDKIKIRLRRLSRNHKYNTQDYIKTLYQLLRNENNTSYYRDPLFSPRESKLNDLLFISCFKYILDKNKIDYQIGFTSGFDIKDVLSIDELSLVIKYGDDLIFSPNINSNYTETPTHVEGRILYLIQKDGLIKQHKSTISTAKSNKTSSIIHVEISNDIKTLFIADSISKQGYSKSYDRDIYYSIDKNLAFKDDSIIKPKFQRGNKKIANRNIRLQKETERIENEKKNEITKQILDSIIRIVQSKKTFQLDSFKIQLLQSGRLSFLTPFKYNIQYNTSELIKSVGGNYAINIGQVIGKQCKINEDELFKSVKFINSSSESFEYTVKLKKLTAFNIIGLENFQTKFSNEVGSFNSLINDKGMFLEIKCNIIFLKNKITSNNLPLFFKLVNEVTVFSEKSLILKPIKK